MNCLNFRPVIYPPPPPKNNLKTGGRLEIFHSFNRRSLKTFTCQGWGSSNNFSFTSLLQINDQFLVINCSRIFLPPQVGSDTLSCSYRTSRQGRPVHCCSLAQETNWGENRVTVTMETTHALRRRTRKRSTRKPEKSVVSRPSVSGLPVL